MYQHKHHLLEGFTSKYDVTRLIWFVQGDDIASAISFEKKIKNRNRQWKIDLIEKTNPDWIDLAANWMDSVPTNTETGMPHAKAPVIPRGEHVTLREVAGFSLVAYEFRDCARNDEDKSA